MSSVHQFLALRGRCQPQKECLSQGQVMAGPEPRSHADVSHVQGKTPTLTSCVTDDRKVSLG